MQSLEASCSEGEPAVKRLKTLRTAASPLSSTKEKDSESKPNLEDLRPRIDIFAELKKLLDEDKDRSDEEAKGIRFKSLILDRLVNNFKLNTVILNLYPGNKGYSLMFRLRNRETNTMCFKEEQERLIQTSVRGYEEDTLLKYVNLEEIPPFILDALDKFNFLFYSGCVIFEIRNYRQAYPKNRYYVHHVLLRPTQRTIFADVNTLTQQQDNLKFTVEDRDAIESEIILAENPKLCLDLDPHLENDLVAVQNRSRIWNHHSFVRMSKKISQVTASRKRKLDCFAQRHGIEILDFCKSKKMKMSKIESLKAVHSHKIETVIPVPQFKEPALIPPSEPISIRFKSLGLLNKEENEKRIENERKIGNLPDEEDCKLYRIEDHILETDIQDQNRSRIYHITLSILYRPATMDFWGELYLDRDYKRGERNGTFCRFFLGTRTLAHRYVYQFTEIFTESGRKMNVRVRSIVHINAPEEVRWPSNAFPNAVQKLPDPKLHMEKMNQLMHGLSFHRATTLENLVQKIFKGDLESDLYLPTDLKSIQMTSQEKLEIDAIANNLELSTEQAAEKAKRQAAALAAHQKIRANTNMISILNAAPVSNANNSFNAAVVNTINNTGQVSNQRLLARRMTLADLAAGGTRVLSHGNNIYTAMPLKNQVVQQRLVTIPSSHQDRSNETVLGALLAETPAADRPEIPNSNNSNSLLLEKLPISTVNPNLFAHQATKTSQSTTTTTQFVVQSPKGNTVVISPMSSPSQSANSVNVQSLNLAQLQNIAGLHNVQFQNFAQPISFSVNVGSQIAGGNSGSQELLMSLPQRSQTVSAGSTGQTMQSFAMNAGVKNLTHHNLRTTSNAQTLQISPGTHQLQLIPPIQRLNRQHNNVPSQATITGRTLQRTTIKMASNSNGEQGATLHQAHPHYQQMLLQQKEVFGKLRRTNHEHHQS